MKSQNRNSGIRFERQWSDEFQEEVLVPIEINEFDDGGEDGGD